MALTYLEKKVRHEMFLEELNRQLKNVSIEDKPKRREYQIPKTRDPYIRKALNAYLNTESVRDRFGHYFIDGSELVYRTVHKDHNTDHLKENKIAIKISTDQGELILGNSSVLDLIGYKSAWGNPEPNRGVTEVQERLTDLGIPMVPFIVFSQAGLDINDIQIIDRGPEESVVRLEDTGKRDDKHQPILEERTVHFTGASLYRLGDKTYLFDIDRRELNHKLFNAFLVEIPENVDTIADAYQALKPQEVLDAENIGLEVLRQGEWFFIPTDYQVPDSGLNTKIECTLKAGPNQPNITTHSIGFDESGSVLCPPHKNAGWGARREYQVQVKTTLVSGTVTHSGREHAPLKLKNGVWYRAIPNTAISSFQISGDVD